MMQLIQFDFEDLKRAIKDSIREEFGELKQLPAASANQEQDEIGLDEACIEAAPAGRPYSKSHIYSLVSKGEIPYTRNGKYLTFSRKTLRRWKTQNSKPRQSAKDAAISDLQNQAKRK